jgi:DNA polymerase III alpha subunit (gram-positive type)
MKVMIFDTETGGLNPKKDSVFSVGALVGELDTGNIIETFEAYHRLPQVSDYVFNKDAIEVHGITSEQAFEKGLPTEEIRDKFTDLYYNNNAMIMGGHNVAFDVRMMSHQIFKIEPQEFESNFTYRFLDSLPMIRLLAGNEEIKSGSALKQTVKMMNIDMSEFGKNKFHAALFDSICCFKILTKFRQIIGSPEFMEKIVS